MNCWHGGAPARGAGRSNPQEPPVFVADSQPLSWIRTALLRARMNGDLLSLHREVNAIAGRQPQVGHGFGGDVGGEPGSTVGLLVGTHPDHGSAAVEFGDRHLDGVARAAVRLVADP